MLSQEAQEQLFRKSEQSEKLLELATRKFGKLTPPEVFLFGMVAAGLSPIYATHSTVGDDPLSATNWPVSRVLRADRLTWLCTDPEASALVTHLGIEIVGARIEGEFRLQYAEIPFTLTFVNCAFQDTIQLELAHLKNVILIGTHTKAIVAGNATIDGTLVMKDGFTANGEVNLIGATITKDLVCARGRFINANGKAIYANHVTVGGGVLMHELIATGEVNFVHAQIGGSLECSRAHLVNKDGVALNANALRVSGGVLLQDGFRAEGEVQLSFARIGGSVECADSEIINSNKIAMSAGPVFIEGDFSMHHARILGSLDISGASIKGNLFLSGGTQIVRPGNMALMALGTRVNGQAFLYDGFRSEGLVILVNASVGTLNDDEKSWPERGQLLLDGLVYNGIGTVSPTDAESRIRWLRRQHTTVFFPQPYEQLATILRRAGRDEDAKEVLIAKNTDRAGYTKALRGEWWWYGFIGKLIGYGYRPWRAFWLSWLFIVSGSFFFAHGMKRGLMMRTKNLPQDLKRPADNYPKFNAFIYSLETFLPLINLRMAEYWVPNGQIGQEVKVLKFRLRTGSILHLYLWVHIAAGWILATLWVGALAGVLKT